MNTHRDFQVEQPSVLVADVPGVNTPQQQSTTDSVPLESLPTRPQESHQDATQDNITDLRHQSVASGISFSSSAETARRAHRRFSRSNTVKHAPSRPTWKPGAEPGIDTDKVDESVAPHLEALRAKCDIVVVDFSHEHMISVEASNENLDEVLSAKRPHHMPCRWISVNGLSWDVIRLLAKKYSFHRLAIEDLINTRTRTKVDWYSDQAFIVLTLQKLVQLHTHPEDPERQCDCSHGRHSMTTGPNLDNEHAKTWRKSFMGERKGSILPYFNDSSDDSLEKDEDLVRPIRTLHRYESGQNPEHTAFMEQNSALSAENQVVGVEQVSIFLMSDNTCISFFEHSAADVEEPILERLKSTATILRRSADASLIVQAIIDAIVDLALPVKDAYNSARKELQIDVLTNPSMKVSKALHIFTEEIDMLQNLFKPIINLINSLRDHNTSAPLGPASIASQSSASSKSSGGRPQGPRRVQTVSTVMISGISHVYLGDVLDHCLTIIQSLEQMDASANNLSDLMFNTISANTNNFMMIIALGESWKRFWYVCD